MTYPPNEQVSYPLDRLDFTVLAVGAVFLILLIIKHIWDND
jgi:hypothetical protein